MAQVDEAEAHLLAVGGLGKFLSIVIEFWYKIGFTWIAANSGTRIFLRVRFTLTRRTGGGKR